MNEIGKEEFEEEVAKWWYRLQHDSGGSARLRHQSDITGIQTVSVFYDLVRVLPSMNTDVLASIAMVLSHVDSDSKEKVAKRMGKKDKGSDHKVSEIRFNKLISLDLQSASRELVRLLPLIDNTLDIRSLATDLRYWDYTNQRTKKQWLNDFYLANRGNKMKYVQIHELVSYPASNLNRDDLGRPKTVKIGESTRLRVSSQSLKRAWRTSSIMNERFPVMGIRTKKLSETIEECLVKGMSLIDWIAGEEKTIREPVDRKTAEKYSIEIDKAFRSSKKGSEEDKDDSKSKTKKQLLHYSDSEIKAVDEIMAEISAGNTPDLKSLLRKDPFPVDIAMFGRMVANNKSFDCEAAVQVAHAFTVHRAVVEEDYFTAVDDLNTDDESGSGHLGETSFGAGLFYNYICIDFELLVKNLGSKELAHEAIKALLEVSATVSPGGKQNTFASRSYASFVMIEKGDRQPRSLASAFLKPVFGDDLLKSSIDALKTTQANMDKVFGKCYDDCYVMDVLAGQGSLSEAGAFLDC